MGEVFSEPEPEFWGRTLRRSLDETDALGEGSPDGSCSALPRVAYRALPTCPESVIRLSVSHQEHDWNVYEFILADWFTIEL